MSTSAARSEVHRRPQGAVAGSASQALSLRGLSGDVIPATVVRTGSGFPVVFLHGLVGLNEHWDGVVSAVSHQCDCRSLELPLLDLGGDDCSIMGVTELTAAYLREHVGQPVMLVGNSFGGHVALRLAIECPELVRGLVLAGSSGLLEKTFVRGAPVRPSRGWLREKIGELFYDTANMREEDLDRAHQALNQRAGARAMVRLSKSARRNHLGDRIRDVKCPALLIWGRNDVVTPPSAARSFESLLPDSRTVWIDECGHVPMVERPDVFAQAMLDFVAELEAGSSPNGVPPAEQNGRHD